MLDIYRKKLFFKIREVWFADHIFEANDCDGIIFRECKRKLATDGVFKETEFTTLVMDLTQDLNDLWSCMSKSSCRYSINKAQKGGVVIKINQNHQEFCEINKTFRDKKHLSSGSVCSVEFVKKYGTLFTSELNGEVLGGCLFLEDQDNIRWLLGASKRLNVDKEKASLIGNANRLVLWEAIKYAKQKGIKEFDFGGIYTGSKKDIEKEKINAFKMSFGGQVVSHYIYEKDYSIMYRFLKYVANLKESIRGFLKPTQP